MNTGLATLISEKVVSADEGWVQVLRMIGSTPIALLISVLVALYVLGYPPRRNRQRAGKNRRRRTRPRVSVILITGAGGMFGGVLRASGIGQALADSMGDLGIPVLLGCFLVAVVLRIAQGSATVALTTAAALMAPAVMAAGYNEWQLACVVLATAAGSVSRQPCQRFPGFWLVGRLLDMDVPTTLRILGPLTKPSIAVIGFALSCYPLSCCWVERSNHMSQQTGTFRGDGRMRAAVKPPPLKPCKPIFNTLTPKATISTLRRTATKWAPAFRSPMKIRGDPWAAQPAPTG